MATRFAPPGLRYRADRPSAVQGVLSMADLVYRFRYAFHLWWTIADMTWAQAWEYPTNISDRGDPIEDANAEMSYMHE